MNDRLVDYIYTATILDIAVLEDRLTTQSAYTSQKVIERNKRENRNLCVQRKRDAMPPNS